MNISDYISGIGAKRLSNVEVDPEISHQHEFNGVSQFKILFGLERKTFQSEFVFFSDDNQISETGVLTWYDSRENHLTRSEHRFYFSSNEVIDTASANDLLVILKLNKTDTIKVIIARHGTTIEQQILWLFELGDGKLERFNVLSSDFTEKRTLDFISNQILESIGIETDLNADSELDLILEKFSNGFPSTREFSAFSSSLIKDDLDYKSDPDGVLLRLIDNEKRLFRTLEKYLVEDRIRSGFSEVDDFISFSLSVHNRRKSRAGHAFENHLSEIFKHSCLTFDNGKITENNAKPDFIFPGIKEYHDLKFDPVLLTMLGAKTTCKDRWRQILSEAERIQKKHLTTLEPSISVNQTEEMKYNKVTLVIPVELHKTYRSEQLNMIISLKDFISTVTDRQKKTG